MKENILEVAQKAAKRAIKKNRDLAHHYEDFVQDACVALLSAKPGSPQYRFAVARNSLVRPVLACFNLKQCATEFQIPKPIVVGERVLDECADGQRSVEEKIDIQRAMEALREAADPVTLDAVLSTKNYVEAGAVLGVTKRVVSYRMVPVVEEVRKRFARR